MTKFVLTLNEEQARIAAKALDFYTRATLGQMWALAQDLNELHGFKYRVMCEQNPIYQMMMAMQPFLTGMGGHASYGIGNPKQHESGKVAHEIGGVLEDALGARRNSPLRVSKQPMPVCTIEPPPEVVDNSEINDQVHVGW